MSPFAIQLINGFLPSDLEDEDLPRYRVLQDLGALQESDNGILKLGSLYRAGRLWIAEGGKGYVEAQNRNEKDLLIEAKDLANAKSGDEVVVKRIIARRGRPSAKVVLITKPSNLTLIGYTHKDENGNFNILHIKTALPIQAKMKEFDLSLFKIGTVLLIDALSLEVIELLGHLKDPKIDEKISLLLYERQDDKFPQDCVQQALKIPSEVLAKEIEGRVDLRELPFCTIDPVTAKDFDDAIYFDLEEFILYVAIADVSHYVSYFSPIDKEAKLRGFTTYLPHKAFPMLPRELSENICSLKPHVDRLAFICKIKLDRDSLKPIGEEFFEGVIHSKRRWNYDEIDAILEGRRTHFSNTENQILKWLLPLQELTVRLRKQRLKKGFDFRSEEIKLTIDAQHLLKSTTIETGTPSHSLIEECMLIANKASAKRFEGDGDSIYRIHEAPEMSKIEELLEELATVGIFIDIADDAEPPSLIRDMQKEAKALGIESEVDSLIIKSLKRASYSPFNIGHFGLGFKEYSHFTSPIRRYSDLILHRLIKANLQKDSEKEAYLLRNIEPLCVRVSKLERDATKAEWDFRDRKFARWALENLGKSFTAQIIEIDLEDSSKGAKAMLECDMKGVVVELKSYNAMLFDRVQVKLSKANIAQATITAQQIEES